LPETHVRVAWALADGTAKAKDAAPEQPEEIVPEHWTPLIAELNEGMASQPVTLRARLAA